MKIKVLATCALFIILSGCSSGPSTSDILEDIPEEISQQYSSGDTTPMSLNDVEIVQSKTEDKKKTIECAFDFSNEYAECTSYWTLFYYQYDDGSWQLESWEKTQEAEARPLQGPSDAEIEEVTNYVNSCIYNPTYTGIEVDLESDTPSAVMHFDVNNSFNLMSESGTMDVIWNFHGESATWEFSFDNSNLNRTWNIEDREVSYGEFGSLVDSYALGFSIKFYPDDKFFRRLNGTTSIKYDIGSTLGFQCQSGTISDVIPATEYTVLEKEMESDDEKALFQQFSKDQCLASWSYPQYLDQDGMWEWHGTLWHRIYICDDAIYYSYVGLDADGKHYWDGAVKQVVLH